MKSLLLSVSAAALAAMLPQAPAAAQTPNTWTNPGNANPIVSTMVGGPWTLNDTAPYCTNGAQNTGANTAGSAMNPYYFPFVIGYGSSMVGYFDYRPSSINESTVAATSTNAGATWNFAGKALQLTAACPSTTPASGSDKGLGHPFVINLNGFNYLYLLDRRGGHVDVDQLIYKRLRSTAASPLRAKPALNATAVQPNTPINLQGAIAGWTFDNLDTSTNNAPAQDPAIGASTTIGGTRQGPTTASATPLGFSNNYYCPQAQNITPATAAFGSITGADVLADTGQSSSPSNSWRTRGAGLLTPLSQACNGWSLDAPEYTQGAQFNVDTTGVAHVLLQFDWFNTNQGVHNMALQYTLNGSTWTTFQTYTAAGNSWRNGIRADFSTIAAAGNNPFFGVRMVSIHDPNLTTYSYTTRLYNPSVYTTDPNGFGPPVTITQSTPGAPATQYSGGSGGAIYNNNSGNWRWDNVIFYDADQASTTTPTPTFGDYGTHTTGLLNPDGLLAAIPGTSPRVVLYVQKQLTSFPSTGATSCGAPLTPGGSANRDRDTIRVATTTDGIHFTDLGATTGLLNNTSVSATALRYAAPNGSIVKLGTATNSSGTFQRYGLFFGAGNCIDGDSDGFHVIAYAENTDGTYLNWTVVNGFTNPIAAVGFGNSGTAPIVPVGSQTSTDPTGWYGGRVYTPQVVYLDPHDISLIFAGYDYSYFSGGLSNYRTIGRITLHSAQTITP